MFLMENEYLFSRIILKIEKTQENRIAVNHSYMKINQISDERCRLDSALEYYANALVSISLNF
jgi:hypothetical protein